jgi:hypothetical protein
MTAKLFVSAEPGLSLAGDTSLDPCSSSKRLGYDYSQLEALNSQLSPSIILNNEN